MSLIPTTTGSATAIGLIYPELLGKLNGVAIRVPLLNASSDRLRLRGGQGDGHRGGQRAAEDGRRGCTCRDTRIRRATVGFGGLSERSSVGDCRRVVDDGD